MTFTPRSSKLKDITFEDIAEIAKYRKGPFKLTTNSVKKELARIKKMKEFMSESSLNIQRKRC